MAQLINFPFRKHQRFGKEEVAGITPSPGSIDLHWCIQPQLIKRLAPPHAGQIVVQSFAASFNLDGPTLNTRAAEHQEAVFLVRGNKETSGIFTHRHTQNGRALVLAAMHISFNLKTGPQWYPVLAEEASIAGFVYAGVPD